MKKIMFLWIGLLLLSSVYALDSLGTFKQGEPVRVTQVCSDATYINISSIAYPNGNTAESGIEMISAGSGEFYYWFNDTSNLGRYQVRGISDGCTNQFAFYFDVTYTGNEISTAQSILSLGFLVLLILVFITNFICMSWLPNKNQTDGEGRILSITYLKYLRNVLWMTGYFLFIGIIFVASNLAYGFLSETLLADVLFMIFRVSFVLSPIVVIVWLIWMFVSFFHDKEFQKMLNRGMFPQGRL